MNKVNNGSPEELVENKWMTLKEVQEKFWPSAYVQKVNDGLKIAINWEEWLYLQCFDGLYRPIMLEEKDISFITSDIDLDWNQWHPEIYVWDDVTMFSLNHDTGEVFHINWSPLHYTNHDNVVEVFTSEKWVWIWNSYKLFDGENWHDFTLNGNTVDVTDFWKERGLWIQVKWSFILKVYYDENTGEILTDNGSLYSESRRWINYEYQALKNGELEFVWCKKVQDDGTVLPVVLDTTFSGNGEWDDISYEIDNTWSYKGYRFDIDSRWQVLTFAWRIWCIQHQGSNAVLLRDVSDSEKPQKFAFFDPKTEKVRAFRFVWSSEDLTDKISYATPNEVIIDDIPYKYDTETGAVEQNEYKNPVRCPENKMINTEWEVTSYTLAWMDMTQYFRNTEVFWGESFVILEVKDDFINLDYDPDTWKIPYYKDDAGRLFVLDSQQIYFLHWTGDNLMFTEVDNISHEDFHVLAQIQGWVDEVDRILEEK